MPAVIEVRHLHKRYGADVAVDDVSFSVEQGEIFGILGPNGAGKTTTVECVEGLRTADRGEIRLLGLDPLRDRAELTHRRAQAEAEQSGNSGTPLARHSPQPATRPASAHENVAGDVLHLTRHGSLAALRPEPGLRRREAWCGRPPLLGLVTSAPDPVPGSWGN